MCFKIRTAVDASHCFQLARKYEQEFKENMGKENWDKVQKELIMKKALIYKFQQNQELLEKLIQTGDAILIEASEKDPYWGGLLSGSKNRLGANLMELRDNYIRTKTLYFE